MLPWRVTGAGVIFLTTIKKELCLIVGREKDKSRRLGYKIYEDFGGGIDKNETIRSAAQRESFEETCKTLKINLKDTMANIFRLRYYRYGLYFIKLEDNMSTKLINTFKQNRKQLIENNAKRVYLEVDKIDFIPLKNFLDDKKHTILKKNAYSKKKEMRVVEIENYNSDKIILSDRLTGIFYPKTKFRSVILEIIDNLKPVKLEINSKDGINTFVGSVKRNNK